MKKKIIVLILVMVMVITCGAFTSEANEDYEVIPVVTYLNEVVVENEQINTDFRVDYLSEFTDINLSTYTMDQLQDLIEAKKADQVSAHELAEAARRLGWPEQSDPIESAKAEWGNSQLAINLYQARYDELYASSEDAKWESKSAEYPAATQIWRYMKSLGWNDYVCAGIMGNLMAEVGGQTLDIQYTLYYKNYYGMCQWSKGYSQIWGAGLKEQCDFLKDTIEYELDTFGYAYKKGFNYDSFLAMSNERDAALAFAKCYERCNSNYYTIRQTNAEKAYNYFVNN